MPPARERRGIEKLRPEETGPLERLLTEAVPDTWQHLARSHYATLLAHAGDRPLPELAELALELAKGIGCDMGGEQPYIPMGEFAAANERFARIITAIERGERYAVIAHREGISDRRVRQIEQEWRRAQLALRQAVLPLD